MKQSIRPTTDKVVQAIFNILGESIAGAKFLELFAGSGRVGIEAIRRGAESVVFVDKDIEQCKVEGGRWKVKPRTLHLSPSTVFLQMDVFSAVKRFAGQKSRFDIIFLDPPYFKDYAGKTLNIISQCDILTKTGIVIAEHHKKDMLPEKIGRLNLLKQKRYGDTSVSFYR